MQPMFEIASYDAQTKPIRARLHARARRKATPWRWPLGRIGRRPPIILDEHIAKDRRSVDIGYVVAPLDSDLHVPVYAAQAGEVSYALEQDDGCAVRLDHGGGVSTHYAHMSKMFVTRCFGRTRRRQYVRAGDVFGYAAKAPLHVRFELWRWTSDRGPASVDPRPELETWIVTSPQHEFRLPNKPSTPSGEAA